MGGFGGLKLHALAAMLGCRGCGKILGVDEYSVDPSERPACGATEVFAEGRCTTVGVTDCGDGFEPDAVGGCRPLISDTPCPGRVQWPGVDCAPITNCPANPRDPGASGKYVKADAPAGGDGSLERPYAWCTATS